VSLLKSIVSSSRALVTGAKDVARLRQIAGVFIKHGFGWAVARMRLRRELDLDVAADENSAHGTSDQDTGRRLVAALTELGPTWIKFGQILSTRPDLIPGPILDELASLQDAVRPVEFSIIDEQIRRALGEHYRQKIVDLDEKPLACASIGQVHRGRLASGEAVALKIQRPSVAQSIRSDIHILHAFAGYLEEAFDAAHAMDLRGVVSDFAKSLAQELDYRSEAANLQRFRRNFESLPEVYFPRIYPELSTSEVLCMEFIEGQKFTTLLANGEPTGAIVKTYFDAAYKMLFIDGFFHGDLHPGNVFVLPDNRIAIIDCGMVGRLSPSRKDKVIDILWAVLNEDLEGLARTFFSLAIPLESVDYTAFEADAISIAERYIGGVPLSQVKIADLFSDLVAAASRHRVRMPTDFTMMFKAIATTEGMARSLAPDIDPIELARPYVTQVIGERYSVEKLQQLAISDFQLLSSTLHALPRSLPLFVDGLRQGRVAFGVAPTTLNSYLAAAKYRSDRAIAAALCAAFALCGTLALMAPELALFAGVPYVSWGFWTLALLFAVQVFRARTP
jgi:ubiquinone biosynthesis protein